MRVVILSMSYDIFRLGVFFTDIYVLKLNILSNEAKSLDTLYCSYCKYSPVIKIM